MGSAVVAAAVIRSQKVHLARTVSLTPSGANHEWNLRYFRTEAVAAGGGDVAARAVKGSPFDASASGSNHRNLREVHCVPG